MTPLYLHGMALAMALWLAVEVLAPFWGGRPLFPRWQLFKAHVRVARAARIVEAAMRRAWRMRAGE